MRSTLLAAAILGALAPAAAAEPAIRAVVGAIDLEASPDSADGRAAFAVLEAFPTSAGAIYLDLTIAPGVEPDGAPPGEAAGLDFGLTRADGTPVDASACAPGGSAILDLAGPLALATGSIYPHLVVEILTAAPGRRPITRSPASTRPRGPPGSSCACAASSSFSLTRSPPRTASGSFPSRRRRPRPRPRSPRPPVRPDP